MCTLIALLGVVPGFPVVVAMNRDEFYDRSSVPPEVRSSSPKIVAPRDARAKGTWIGVNESGLVAAVSNRLAGTPDPSARSRGLLCVESLAMPDVAAATMFTGEETERHAYNPFNLLHADPHRIACTSHESGTWAAHGMMGVNVLTNAGLNRGDPRERRVRTLLVTTPAATLAETIRTMRVALADHEDAGGRAICHHGERTGTRSQTIIAVSKEGWRRDRLWYAEGFPCTAKSEELSDRFR